MVEGGDLAGISLRLACQAMPAAPDQDLAAMGMAVVQEPCPLGEMQRPILTQHRERPTLRRAPKRAD